MTNGYDFYFKVGDTVLTFPITPGELKIKVGSKNKTINLINEGEVNILKSPSLIEVEFEARFPMRKYPYSREVESFQSYFDVFKDLKENKKSFRFIVARTTPGGVKTWDTNLLMAIEDFTLNESADEGDDVLIDFKLKQFKEFGVKVLSTDSKEIPKPTTQSTTKTKNQKSTTYVVKSGDCLWNIAKRFYGDGSKWTVIYNANKAAIEADAKEHGLSSSSNGHWIFPGLKLTIPGSTTDSGSTSSGGGTSKKKTSKTPDTVLFSLVFGPSRFGNSSSRYNTPVRNGSVTVTYKVDGLTRRYTGLASRTFKVDYGSTVHVKFRYTQKYAGFKVTYNSPGGKGSIAKTKMPSGNPISEYTDYNMTKNGSLSVRWENAAVIK